MIQIFRKFVKYITFPIIANRDGLKGLVATLQQLEKSQYWPPERILEFQLGKLRDLLIHAYKHTKFYKHIFDESSFNPFTFRNPEDLNKLPILTKQDIRKYFSDLIADNLSKAQLHESETGGTTGVKMKFLRDNACLSPKEAALYRFEKWTGWDFGERMGLVWPATEDYVGYYTMKAKVKNEFSRREVVFPAAIMDEESISNYVHNLQQKRPTIIRAFTSPIYELAKYIKDQSININLKGIITTGEPLFDHQRNVIQSAFGCEVFDSYRTREAGPVAQECNIHNGMHVNAEGLYVEVEQLEHDKFDNDRLGNIIITDLWNYGMPFIRYDMGDLGNLSGDLCPCGRGLPLLKNIAGRTADIFYTHDKKRIAAVTLVLYLVDEAPGQLGQVQIVQNRLDHIVIRMTPDPLPSEEIKVYQTRKVKELFGPQMKVSFEIVDEIPRDLSGKYIFTVCQINKT